MWYFLSLRPRQLLPLGLIGLCVLAIYKINETLLPGYINVISGDANKMRNESSNVEDFNWNPYDIQLSINPKNSCVFRETNHPKLLIIVKSYVGDFEQRLAIRKTWGNTSKLQFKVVFIVGYQDYAQQLLDYESELFNDIIQFLFFDKYDNNILKTCASYQWLTDQCEDSDMYILFSDDDFFVNVGAILTYLQTNDVEFLNDSMLGYLYKWRFPKRSKKSKWFVSYSEYKYWFWPPYLGGGSILTHINVVKRIYHAFPFVRYIHIDDTFVSTVANFLQIRLIHENRISCDYIEPSKVASYFSSHGYGFRGKLKEAWQQLL